MGSVTRAHLWHTVFFPPRSDECECRCRFSDVVAFAGDNKSPYVFVVITVATQVDRSPCGSGVSARVALQHRRGVLPLGQRRHFRSEVTGSKFKAGPLKEIAVNGAGLGGESVIGVVVEVSGRAHYTGSSTFTAEGDDPLAGGFLPR